MINFGNILKNNIIYWVSRAITLVFALVICLLCLDSFYEIIPNALRGDVFKSYLLANGDIVKAVFRSLAFIYGFTISIVAIYYTIRTKSFSKRLLKQPNNMNDSPSTLPILAIIILAFGGFDAFNIFLSIGTISAWIFIMTSRYRLQNI